MAFLSDVSDEFTKITPIWLFIIIGQILELESENDLVIRPK